MLVQLRQVPAGEAGTSATLAEIGRMLEAAMAEPEVRLLALDIVRSAGANPSDPALVASALFGWVRGYVDYLPDPVDVETVQAPMVTVALRVGDCDDQALLVAALAQSLGIEARFKVTGESADRFVHIWPELKINGQWIPADTTEAGQLGEQVRTLAVVKTYSAKGTPMFNLGNPTVDDAVTGISENLLYRTVFNATMVKLNSLWNTRQMAYADVEALLSAIDAGEIPHAGTPAETPIRDAVANFLDHVRKQAGSSRLSGMHGMRGLSGIFSGVVGAITGAVSGAVSGIVGKVTGGNKDAPYGIDFHGVPIDEAFFTTISNWPVEKLLRDAEARALVLDRAPVKFRSDYWKVFTAEEIYRKWGIRDENGIGEVLTDAGEGISTAAASLFDNPLVLVTGGLVAYSLLKGRKKN